MAIRVLALDIEATIVSNVMTQIARPGLRSFLMFCLQSFDRVVLFTALSEERAREVMDGLVVTGDAPPQVKELEYIHWSGRTKDLRFVPNAQVEEILLLDDEASYIHPEQRAQWVPIKPFLPPYVYSPDRELKKTITALEDRL